MHTLGGTSIFKTLSNPVRLNLPATQPTSGTRRFQGEYVLLLPPLPEAPLQKFVYEPPDAGKDEVHAGRGSHFVSASRVVLQ